MEVNKIRDRSPHRSLLDLPQELLENICSHLCRHCSEPTEPSRIVWPAPNMMRCEIPGATLLDASLACRQLRDAAQPFLFHSVGFRADPESGWDLGDYLSPLLRTLRYRKDLRARVRHLEIDARDSLLYCCDHSLPALSRKATKTVKKICEEVGLPLADDSLQGKKTQETLLQILLAILPNLAEIRIVIPRDWNFGLLSAWRTLRAEMGVASAWFLPAVRTMLLEMDDIKAEECTDGHRLCDKPCPSSPVEELLVEAAPNLKLLSCTASGLNNLPALPHLTHLQLWMRGSWEDKVFKLMERLPTLTHLAYWANNEHGPVPGEVQRALAPQRDTLELLSLSYSKRFMDTEAIFSYAWNGDSRWEPPRRHDFVLGSFADFTKLRSLTMDDHMFWRDQAGFPASTYEDTRIARDLVGFLPPSLELLFVFNSVGTPLALDALAQAMVDGSRPALRRVFWAEFTISGFYVMDREDSYVDGWLEDDTWKKELHEDVSELISDRLYVPFADWGDIECYAEDDDDE